MMLRSNPIGVFDSGVGGLSVYRALRAALPHENFIYLGDTARLPYGTKSKEEIERYTLEAASFLLQHQIKYFVIACNTVSAQALDALQKALPDLSYGGVIATGAEAAIKATKNGHIALLATTGTVRSGVYPEVIQQLKPGCDVQMLACGALVTLVEEGEWDGAVAETAVTDCLSQLKPGYDTLVLACTHFPILMPLFQKICAPEVQLIDSAAATAQMVAGLLMSRDMANPQSVRGADLFFVTQKPDSFVALGSRILGQDITKKVKLHEWGR